MVALHVARDAQSLKTRGVNLAPQLDLKLRSSNEHPALIVIISIIIVKENEPVLMLIIDLDPGHNRLFCEHQCSQGGQTGLVYVSEWRSSSSRGSDSVLWRMSEGSAATTKYCRNTAAPSELRVPAGAGIIKNCVINMVSVV